MTYNSLSSELIHQLTTIVGEDNLSTAQADRDLHAPGRCGLRAQHHDAGVDRLVLIVEQFGLEHRSPAAGDGE